MFELIKAQYIVYLIKYEGLSAMEYVGDIAQTSKPSELLEYISFNLHCELKDATEELYRVMVHILEGIKSGEIEL